MKNRSGEGNEPTVQEKATRLRSFHFFRDCPEDFFLSLAMITEIRFAPAGTLILEEGKLNDSLYLLLEGKVDVLVQGERVACLQTPGDLLGEMSVITARPASATILALESISYFAVSAAQLDERVRKAPGEFGFHLYRTYALMLSEKMVLTNDKARRFDMANRALLNAIQSLEVANQTLDKNVQERTADLERSYQRLEAQNTELHSSHRKLEELYTSKEVTFKTLTDLTDGYLAPLDGTLRDLESGVPESSRPQIRAAIVKVESSLAMLRPLTSLYSTERAMKSRRVLLIESDRKQQVIAKLALGGTGVRLDIAGDATELSAILASGEHVDIAFVSPDFAAQGAEIHARYPNVKLVFMASPHIPSFLPTLREHPFFTNIVSRDEDDRTFTVKNIMTTVTKLLARDLFGLEKYLIWGVETETRSVGASDERVELIAEMQEKFGGLGVRSRISDRAALVAEEMLMNAIYDAPHGPDGKALYNHLPRTHLVKLRDNERAEFRYACDGMLAAISVSDPFGCFRSKILLDYLDRNYSGTTEPQGFNKGGAGRGLHQIIENSDLVVINVRPKARTEMIALFNLDPQAKSAEGRPSFHFFMD